MCGPISSEHKEIIKYAMDEKKRKIIDIDDYRKGWYIENFIIYDLEETEENNMVFTPYPRYISLTYPSLYL
ncbi:MAG: hypothetical protein ACMUJM_05490 [bacterium]